MDNPFRRLSKAPTNPAAQSHAARSAATVDGADFGSSGGTLNTTTVTKRKAFDVEDLYRGPLVDSAEESGELDLDEKLRQAYFWIVNTAIISPHYDIEFHDGPSAEFQLGDSKAHLTLPSGQSYSSFVLLPLLTFATRTKCLFIGGPGRGKTASALLMGVLAGYPAREIRRGMQHGHPQMTIADLLGNPLPADLVSAQSMTDIRIAWRSWLGMRIKVIDEYNRIPTRTQSALLTVMGDGYAEVLDQIYECPESAWYLTANDDKGGGTYAVIEALRDRVDVTVQAMSFNSRFLFTLLERVESGLRPEDTLPPEIVFNEAQIDAMGSQIRAVVVPDAVRRRIEFFTSQFEFSESAAVAFEYRTKDTLRLAGGDSSTTTPLDTGRDRTADLGCQTRNGLSVRNLMTLLLYAKAIAWFRGSDEVTLDDVGQVLPFVLRDKLVADTDAPFFDANQNAPLRTDPIGWLRTLFASSCREFDRLDLDRVDPVLVLQNQFELGLDGVSEAEVRKRLVSIEALINEWSRGRKLYGHIYDDLLDLKYLHQRYTNYLRWLETQ
jgi:MoxR-like ATPase